MNIDLSHVPALAAAAGNYGRHRDHRGWAVCGFGDRLPALVFTGLIAVMAMNSTRSERFCRRCRRRSAARCTMTWW